MNSEQHDSGQDSNSSYTYLYPPKPEIADFGQKPIRRSLFGLIVYALLFYFIFDQNLAYIAAILLVIVVHEMGHFLCMRLFDYQNVKIFILPLLGAFTTGKKQQVSQLQLSIIILAGPVPGIVIGSLLYWINLHLNMPALQMLANTFLIINLLNSLPVYPLDGGRLVETLFFKDNHIIRLVFGLISIVVLLILCLVLMSPFLIIVPLMIGIELYNENKHSKIRDYLKQEKINYCIDYKYLSDRDYWTIRDCILLSFSRKYSGYPAGKLEYSPFELVLVNHVNNILQVNLKFDLKGFRKILVLLFYITSIVLPVLLVLLNTKTQ